MAQYQLLLPKMGESVAEAVITKWLKKPGDRIDADEAVVEIATDKVDSDVPSPVSGRLIEQLFKESDVAQVGQVLAVIETDDDAAIEEIAPLSETAADETGGTQPQIENVPGIDRLEENPVSSSPQNEYSGSSRFYSPLVKSIAAEEGISLQELEQLQGSGAGGRVTKEDILNYVKSRKAVSAEHRTELAAKIPVEESPVSESYPFAPAVSVSGQDEIIEMDRMRKLIADHMVMSKRTSPHVTSFVEADVTNLVKWRERVKSAFEKREGQKITFTPIFVEAVAKAIKDMPMINVSVSGDKIIKKKDINIGLAAALPSGNLIVPVIRSADQLNLVGLTKAVNDLASRARSNKLQPDEVKDGTFTLTNIGQFGNDMGIPIINQPQAAILAVGAIKKKPAVIETEFGDMIGIRHMMFLSMSYDHRIIDGALGGSFIRRVADYLEGWDIHREV